MGPNDKAEMANTVDPDQTAPFWVCSVCIDLSFPAHRSFVVAAKLENNHKLHISSSQTLKTKNKIPLALIS